MNGEEYRLFIENNNMDNLFIHIILTDINLHPIDTKVSIVFIYNLNVKKLYYFCFDHQDGIPIISLNKFIEDISRFTGKVFVFDKKSFIQKIPIKNVYDINFGLFLTNDKIFNIEEFYTQSHKIIYRNLQKYSGLNKVIPLTKHIEMVSRFVKSMDFILNNDIFNNSYYLTTNTIIIETLSELELNGIFVNSEQFEKIFGIKPVSNGFVYSMYNIYTHTSRPSNRFGGVNYSALNKENGSRECFISRFGNEGKLILMDYSAFHPRIIANLTEFRLPVNIDFYEYIAKLFFNKNIIDKQDINDAKKLTFQQLYGEVEEKYSHIQYFYNLKTFIDRYWQEYLKTGCVYSFIFDKKIQNIQNPTPNKVFNYLLQAEETELVIPIINEINKFLRNKLSKPILYTYDSLLFDVHINEMDMIYKDVCKIMSMNNRYPMKIYTGDSYGMMKEKL